jgi:DNA-binding transcriptional regulator of glucitol operon
MSGARQKLSTALTAEELKFLEAIKKTQEETSPPPSVDVGAIAAKAFASYLEGLAGENTETEPIPGIAAVLTKTTPGLTKTVANLIGEESNEQKPFIHFRRDFIYTVVPTIVLAVLGIGYLLFRSKVNLSSSLLVSSSVLVKSSIAVTVLTAVGFTVWFLVDPDRISNHLRSIRYSGGALTGGLAVAALALLTINYGLDQRGKWQNTRIENTSREMAELGFATVGSTVGTNLEGKTRLNFVGSQQTAFVLKSEQSGEAVKVEAKPDKDRTNASVVLDIVPYSAKVYSFGSTVADYEVLTGKVDYSDQNQDFVEIKPDGGATPIKITLDSNARQLMFANFSELRESGLTGKDVKVLFVPKSSQALKMSWRRQGTDELIYNSASASLKQAAASSPAN